MYKMVYGVFKHWFFTWSIFTGIKNDSFTSLDLRELEWDCGGLSFLGMDGIGYDIRGFK